MGYKNKAAKWKAEAKALRARLKKLRRRIAAHDAEAAPPPPQTAAPAPTASKAKGPVSPLAPAGGFPALPAVGGVAFAAAAAGVRYPGRTDVMLVGLAPGTALAGVFTRSSTRAACVMDCQAKLAGNPASEAGAAIIVNSGNANAFTGAAGQASVDRVTRGVAAALDLPHERVLSCSTGVIGEPLPDDRITARLDDLKVALSEEAAEAAARAIMTTDTFPKGAWAEIDGDGGPIRIVGIAKGSGMIAPDMATMLVYLFTDAAIAPADLQMLLSRNVDATFNAITVDGDTSTSDSLILAATGRSPARPITDMTGADAHAFETALHGVMRDLAQQVVRDGEGATKFVEIRLTGAASAQDAHRAAMAIANSPLVKTAIAGEDPNWGRIVAAIGKSGARAERDLLSIRFGDILVAENGWRAPDYREEEGAAHMKGQELLIQVDLGVGTAAKRVWTCDLTHRYIDINADYRS